MEIVFPVPLRSKLICLNYLTTIRASLLAFVFNHDPSKDKICPSLFSFHPSFRAQDNKRIQIYLWKKSALVNAEGLERASLFSRLSRSLERVSFALLLFCTRRRRRAKATRPIELRGQSSQEIAR